jgi:hypothetical protein
MELKQVERSCGNCDVCCNILEVRELNKKSYCNCTYRAEGGGCGRYDTRPSICRDWNCAYILNLIPGGEEVKPNNIGLMFYPVSAKNNDLGMSMIMGQEVWKDALLTSDAQNLVKWIGKRMFVMIRHYNTEEFSYSGPKEQVEEFLIRHHNYMSKQNNLNASS